MSSEINAFPYKRLKVWEKSIDFVTEIYKITCEFPKQEQYGLISQMRRCAVSISSNIAEGHGRTSDKELIRFIDIARGSVYELDTQIEISKKLNYLTSEKYNILSMDLDEISRMLTGLRKFKTSNLKSHNSNLKSK